MDNKHNAISLDAFLEFVGSEEGKSLLETTESAFEESGAPTLSIVDIMRREARNLARGGDTDDLAASLRHLHEHLGYAVQDLGTFIDVLEQSTAQHFMESSEVPDQEGDGLLPMTPKNEAIIRQGGHA
ncbi:hypothetical protein [Mesorhizobium sp.]|uniref:hypothetical protein n=1 Tax=Mesorhizobium sp. TaxID=1871066 RepID=UPI0012242C29|nr:hypothetical protein [Mesorhizobium sp.]TIS37418.1 MAG: hypothetical protein E5W95_17510 [Mesorhizobium sp.]